MTLARPSSCSDLAGCEVLGKVPAEALEYQSKYLGRYSCLQLLRTHHLIHVNRLVRREHKGATQYVSRLSRILYILLPSPSPSLTQTCSWLYSFLIISLLFPFPSPITFNSQSTAFTSTWASLGKVPLSRPHPPFVQYLLVLALLVVRLDPLVEHSLTACHLHLACIF